MEDFYMVTMLVDWMFLIGLFFAAAKIIFHLYDYGELDSRAAAFAILLSVLYAFVLYFRYSA